MKPLRFLLLIFAVFGSCIERFDVPVLDTEHRVVVNGMITNEPGPYTVELYWSSRLNESLKEAVRITDAEVTISDHMGNSEVLTEESDGVYKTHAGGIQGVVGRKYQLTFITTDGTIYESVPGELQPAGEITDLYFEFKKDEINSHDISLPQNALAIYADGRGEEGYPNLLRWRWSGIFHIITFPHLRTKFVPVPGGGSAEVPDPEPCSIPVCLCCDCWIHQTGREAVVSNNNLINGINFNRVLLTKIPIADWTFDQRYYFEAQQISVQPEVYDFWKLVGYQQQAASNIFQPNVASIKGNIRCVSDPQTKVYGVFSVSAIARKSFFIHRNEVPQVPPFIIVKADCKKVFKEATYERPVFW